MEDENSDDDEAFEAFQRELDEIQRETIDEARVGLPSA
jgi:hypothetical protein